MDRFIAALPCTHRGPRVTQVCSALRFEALAHTTPLGVSRRPPPLSPKTRHLQTHFFGVAAGAWDTAPPRRGAAARGGVDAGPPSRGGDRAANGAAGRQSLMPCPS